MNEEPLRLEKATHPDGFVDFYTMLGVSSDTPPEEIQENINSLYQEAQMHRDHRVPARRREYQTLLEILPQARLVLLDEARSKRYKAYCHAVEMELPRMPHTEFLGALVREKEATDTRTDILTIRDLSRLRLATVGAEADAAPSAEEAEEDAPTAEMAEATETAPLVKEEPKAEKATLAPAIATSAPAPAPHPIPSNGPVSEGQRFSFSSLLGGGFVLAGLLVALPVLTGIPIVFATALSAFSAGICAYVFSLAGEVIEA